MPAHSDTELRKADGSLKNGVTVLLLLNGAQYFFLSILVGIFNAQSLPIPSFSAFDFNSTFYTTYF